MSEARDDQRWMTYKQASAAGGQVRKGEVGTPIEFWKFTEDQTQVDAAGVPVRDARGQPIKATVELERPRVFFAVVFNAEQIDGMAKQEPRGQQAWGALERVETILDVSGAVIHAEVGDRAFYRPATDSIHLPDKSQFRSAAAYYATALHELGHWTGHPTRLDRDLVHPFGSEGYAREELRAEIASMVLGDELGIGHDPGHHAAYVGAWIKALQEDPLEIFRAAADAEKIQSYVMGLELVRVHEKATAINVMEDEMTTLQKRQNEEVAEPAEDWMLAKIVQGGLPRALDKASVDQIGRMQDVVTRMMPVDGRNDFWQRHALPADVDSLAAKVERAAKLMQVRHGDARVAEARLELVTGFAFARQRIGDDEAFEREAQAALGFTLPLDWSGRIRVEGLGTEAIDGKPHLTTLLLPGTLPEAWGVFAQHRDGHYAMLSSVPMPDQAADLAERLAIIDARSTVEQHEQQAKLARIHEERVRRDAGSTPDDVAMAKEWRKNAEFAAAVNDEDLQRRIAAADKIAAQGSEAGISIPDTSGAGGKVFISVPFKEKNAAKARGAKWDRGEQSWYIPAGVDAGLFAQWQIRAASASPGADRRADGDSGAIQSEPDAGKRQYLAVPYEERAAAKAAGASWDRAAKSWYADQGTEMEKLAQWLPLNVPVQQDPAMSPREEFAIALVSVGCVVAGDHPVMDGEKHRISVEGERFSANAGSGFYVAHLDGHPAGYVKNNKTGVELTWKSKGYVLDPERRASLAAQAAANIQEREAEQSVRQEQVAQRLARQIEELVPVVQPTTYMLAKGIDPQEGAFTDQEGRKTYLPAFDVDGKLWTVQYIQEDGVKRFAKDSKKTGCFHVVGGQRELAGAPVIVIAEGYATAATLKQGLGFATVSAFDSGNLVLVAQALHAKYPGKPMVIAGDDDRHLELAQAVNPGRTKAEEAAALVGGTVLSPIFAPGENCYPADLPPVTPDAYRAHVRNAGTLSDEQLAALDRMKQFTDFNDLVTKSTLGRGAIERQVRSLVDTIIESQVRGRNVEQEGVGIVEHAFAPAPQALRLQKPKQQHVSRLA